MTTIPIREKTEETKPVRVDSTLAKGLQVLEALAQSKTGKGVTELARELDLTKSNTFRLLQSLTALGYVRSSENKLYAPTMKVWQIGQTIIGHLDLKAIAADEMRALSKATGETIYLAVPDGLSVVYIDKIDSLQPIRSWNPIGGSAPLHCVGTGKALLAANYGHLREQIRDHLTKFTDRTITSIRQLDDDVAATRARGYAIDTGEYRERIYSFGAAIRLPNGDAIAALGVSVPDVNLGDDKQATICASVARAAEAVSEALAGH